MQIGKKSLVVLGGRGVEKPPTDLRYFENLQPPKFGPTYTTGH